MPTGAKARTRVTNAACAKCDRQDVVLVRIASGHLYCLPCYYKGCPALYNDLCTWIKDHEVKP